MYTEQSIKDVVAIIYREKNYKMSEISGWSNASVAAELNSGDWIESTFIPSVVYKCCSFTIGYHDILTDKTIIEPWFSSICHLVPDTEQIYCSHYKRNGGYDKSYQATTFSYIAMGKLKIQSNLLKFVEHETV